MLSPADMLIIGAAALIFFGPDQLPKVARRAGQVVRDVQNTSQSFIREMERAADASDHRPEPDEMSPHHEYRSYEEPTPAPESPSAPQPAMNDPIPAAHTSDAAVGTPGKVDVEAGRTGTSYEDASGI